jgi:alpha-galactosidase
MVHEVWGGLMWQLDTTHPEVRDHLSALAKQLVGMGYRYLKLDFTFSAGLPARVHDPTTTPAERVRAGYDAIRAGAGDDVFILGCGAPLGSLVGVVDGMRIGADVAPWWEAPADSPLLAGYEDAAPATRHAFTNTLSRAFQHRRLWLNDPDCLMLRTSETALTPEAIEVWCRTVAGSGGLALVSDDLALLDRKARALLDAAVTLGRHVDEEARAGSGPRCADILDPDGPTTLQSANSRFVVDPLRPRGVVEDGGRLSDLWRIRP